MSLSITKRFTTATVRLTAWYLSILMLISVLFSVALYQTSSRELANNARRQMTRIEQLGFDEFEIGPIKFTDFRNELEQSRAHLRASLIVYNMIILVAGGAASYWFARRTLRPIENALEVQSRFTADASHELRTPLTAMRSEIEVALRDKNLNISEARELLKSNIEEIGKLEALSASLLQLAHYEEGSSAVSFRKVALKPLVEKSIATLSSVATKRRVVITTNVEALKIEADAASIQELVAILVDNAIKYSAGGGKVQVSAFAQNGQAIIKVEDQGLGIKASEIPHLFERFYRADTSRSKTRIDGYGLGLSIAKSIVEAHRGTIEVASTLGEGSAFTVKLPLSQRQAGMPV